MYYTLQRTIGLFTLIFLLGCATSKKAPSTATVIAAEQMEDLANPLQLIFSGLDEVEDRLAFTYLLKNESQDSILILKPRPIVEHSDFVPANVPPEFFRLSVTPTNVLCEYAPTNSGTANVKTVDDFVVIAPGATYSFSINPSHFSAEICNTDIAEVKTVLSYEFDDRYLDKSFFETRVKRKGNLSQEQSDKLYLLMQNTYRYSMQTDTISLEVEAFMH